MLPVTTRHSGGTRGGWEYMHIKVYGMFKETMGLKLVIKLLRLSNRWVGKWDRGENKEGGGYELLQLKLHPAFQGWEEVEVAQPLAPGCLHMQIWEHSVPLEGTPVLWQPRTRLLTQWWTCPPRASAAPSARGCCRAGIQSAPCCHCAGRGEWINAGQY